MNAIPIQTIIPRQHRVQPLCDFKADGTPERVTLLSFNHEGPWLKITHELRNRLRERSRSMADWLDHLEISGRPVVYEIDRGNGAKVEIIPINASQTPHYIMLNRLTAEVYPVIVNADGSISYHERSMEP